MDYVRVKAWVGGYEYSNLEAVSEAFDMEEGVEYVKYLAIEIPNNIDVGEDNIYTLHLEIYDTLNSIEETYSIYFERQRHNLEIIDVMLSSTELQAGELVFAKARVKNIGDRKEEEIKVIFSIPELGISASTYIDELAAFEIANEDEEDSASSQAVYLKIPEYAKPDTYTISAIILYNNGYSKETAETLIEVRGQLRDEKETAKIIFEDINALREGKEEKFSISILNYGKKAEFSGEILCSSGNCSASNPVEIREYGSGKISFTIKPETAGEQQFIINIYANGQLVESKLYNVEVKERNYGLLIGILAVIIIVLVAVVLIKRKI
ncbi:hypothetical protein HZB88_03730 [archaeon]|nr:hypothetical protein [archaeon]